MTDCCQEKPAVLLLSLNPQLLHPVSEGAGFHLQHFSSTTGPINFTPGFIEDALDMLALYLVKTIHLICAPTVVALARPSLILAVISVLMMAS